MLTNHLLFDFCCVAATYWLDASSRTSTYFPKMQNSFLLSLETKCLKELA